MFKKKKLYIIRYKLYATYTTIISAKNEFKAIDKLMKQVKETGITPDLISINEYPETPSHIKEFL